MQSVSFLRRAVLASLGGLLSAQAPDARTLLTRHCAECHRGADAERGFDVDTLLAPDASADAIAHAALRLRTRTMPPPDAEAPDAAARAALLQALAALRPPEPGARVPTARRLSRTQYGHVVRDLFGLTVDADRLPPDARVHGFDTVGDGAGITPLLFELYLALARDLAERVVADETVRARVLPDGVPIANALPPLLERAFRRAPTARELAEREALFQRERQARGIDAARTVLLQSILASPSFLVRTEAGRTDAPGHLTAHELAGRLSFAFTSSAPDAELLALARTDALDAAAVANQALRLLRADQGRRFADDFAAQWLRSRDVLTQTADFRKYGAIWNGRLRPSLAEEVAQLVMAIVRDDLPVTTLLDADFTYVDATLAKHYGLPEVAGDAFVRVALPDRRRGGLLGTGAMLMVSSYPGRTSPVLRGKWLLDTLLDAPPPPPPANVAALPADDTPVDGHSLRARLEQHRRDRGCAGCHAQIDPLGFALENYDVLGRWRDDLHGQPIDSRGTLPDGTELGGPVALKDALLQRRDDVVRTFAARLLVFAVGRPLLLADEGELQRIVARSADGGHRVSALVTAVVTSPLFTLRDPDQP